MPLLLLLLLAVPTAAQVTVAASADPTTVGVGEVVAFTLEVEGDLDGLGEVRPPSTRGLNLIGRAPVFRSQTTTSGGGRLTLRWLYRAVISGPAEIGAARIPLGRRTLATDPIRVEVRPTAPPRPTPPPPVSEDAVPAGDLFVRAEPSTRRAFVGQQVVVTYVLYFDPHLAPRRAQTLGSWSAPGFWREELDVGPDETFPRTQAVGGRTLAAVTLRRVALFPTRAGRLDVGAMTFGVDVLRPDGGGPFGSLFSPFSSRLEEERLTAPAFALDAEALPPGAPAAFGGAVGQFGLAAALDRDRVATGEGVRLTVTLAGTGNTAALGAPAVAAPSGWEVFGPEESREVDRRLAPLEGRATFAYTLVPRGGGRFEVPPVTFAYFDPEAGQYRTLASAPLPVVVEGPPARTLAATSDPDAPLGPMTNADWERTRPSERPSGWWLALGAALPLATLAAFTVARRRSNRPHVLRASASPLPRDGLDGDPAAFHRDVERAVRQAVAARYGVSSALSRPALRDALADAGAPADVGTEVDALLRTSEEALYAPGPPPDRAVGESLAVRTRRLLARMEDQT